MKRILLIALLLFGLVSSYPTFAHAKVWSLENTPKEFRPKLCADVRKELAYNIDTQSYKLALKRQAEGNMWQIHKDRISQIEGLRDSYRRLNCKAYP
jgi:hypothetical protein